MVSTSDSQGQRESEESEGRSDAESLFVDLFTLIRGSFLHFMIAAGIVVAILGATPLFDGAEAGLVGVVGVSLILYGLIGIAALRLIGYSG